MYRYFIDLNILSYENTLYADKSNLERIVYLFGESHIELVVPEVKQVSNINIDLVTEVKYDVLVGGTWFLNKKILNESRIAGINIVLMSGNYFFLTSVFNILYSFSSFKLIYIGSISSSYFYSKFGLINLCKYFASLVIEFICFFSAREIFAAGGTISPRLFNFFFRKKITAFNTKYFSVYLEEDFDYVKKFNSNIVVFVGLISYQKGMNENIKFFRKISSLSRGVYRFVLIGKKYDEQYSDFFNEPGVEYRGYLSDLDEIRSVLEKAKFLILFSKHEGMARAPLEAMYYGTPVLTNGVGTMGYCNPRNSLIASNPESLANEVFNLSLESYCQMAKAAFETSKLFNGNESPIIR